MRGTEIFRHNVKYLRDLKKITQEELAAKANLSAQEISKIERGKVNPKLTVILSIAEGFEVHPSTLFESYLNADNIHLCYDDVTEMMLAELNKFSTKEKKHMLSVIWLIGSYLRHDHEEENPSDSNLLKKHPAHY